MKTSKALEVLSPGAKWNLFDQNYDTLQWLSPEIPQPTKEQVEAKIEELRAQEPMKLLRVHRDKLLAETDWMANFDVTMSDAWKTYRQELRDLPSTATPVLDSSNILGISGVTWPTKP
jgi:hypothetical protein